jgi:hypothetical protein
MFYLEERGERLAFGVCRLTSTRFHQRYQPHHIKSSGYGLSLGVQLQNM